MMRRRGFTLIELGLVLILTTMMSTVTLSLYLSFNAAYQTALLQGQLKLDTQRAAGRIFHFSQEGGGHIDPDQRGLHLKDGSQVRWDGQRLLLRGHSLLSQPVTGFVAIRREGRLRLTLEVEAPSRWRGTPGPVRFDYEEGLGEVRL